MTIATLRFRPVAGTAGRTTTTGTFLGALLGAPSTNSFSYRSKTTVVEGTFTNP